MVTTSKPAASSAASIAALITGSASVAMRPTLTAGRRRPDEAGLEQLHAQLHAGDVTGHRADRVERLAQRPHPAERHPTERRLQPDDATARSRDAHRSPGVGPVGDIGVTGTDGDRRAARRTTREQCRIERVDRRAEPWIRADPGHRKLREVGLAHDAGVGGPRPRHALGILQQPVLRCPRLPDSRPWSAYRPHR